MTVDVAVIDAQAVQFESGLAALESQIVTADSAEDLSDTATKLREVRQFMRIRKAATEYRVRAGRLEAMALRRIGQIGCPQNLSSYWKGIANGFASLSDDEFASLLEASSGREGAPAIWRSWTRDRRREYSVERGALGAQGDLPPAVWRADVTDRHKSIREAVGTLLGVALEEGEPFTVSSVTERLVDTLGLEGDSDHPAIFDPDFRAGMAEVVRLALRHDGPARNVQVAQRTRTWMPKFVTYESSDGWVRVPLANARVWQLEEMARFRKEQALMVADGANDLSLAVDACRQAGGLDDSRIGDLFGGGLAS